MAGFGGFFITNKGRALQAKAQVGTVLHYNRIAIGDGVLASGQQISDLTGMVSQKMTLPITKLKPLTDGKAVVGTSYNNNDVAVGFYLREIGVFAQDPDEGEILYCYANAGASAEFISAGGSAESIEKYINVQTIVGNAASVTATIDDSLVFVTVQDFTTHQTAAVLDHPDGSVTDAKIGNRTITDTAAPTGDSGTLTTLFGWLGNMIKAITGKSSWRTAPATTLEAANTHINATTGVHGATSLGNANKIPIRDASGRFKVGAPAAADDVARKDTVDNHANRTDNPHGVTAAQVGALPLHGTADFALHASIQDTRDVLSPPNYYPMGRTCEFKRGAVMGLPNEGYVSLETIRPYVDDSGGYSFQNAYGMDTGRRYVRKSISATQWDNWQFLPTDSVVIPANADLNSYTTEGDYFNGSNADTQTLLNRASNSAFHLRVTKHAGVNQTVIEFMSGSVFNIYTRNLYDNIWSGWVTNWHSGNNGPGKVIPLFNSDSYGSASTNGSTVTAYQNAGSVAGDLVNFPCYIDPEMVAGRTVYLEVVERTNNGGTGNFALYNTDGTFIVGCLVGNAAYTRVRSAAIPLSSISGKTVRCGFYSPSGGTLYFTSARLIVI